MPRPTATWFPPAGVVTAEENAAAAATLRARRSQVAGEVHFDSVVTLAVTAVTKFMPPRPGERVPYAQQVRPEGLDTDTSWALLRQTTADNVAVSSILRGHRMSVSSPTGQQAPPARAPGPLASPVGTSPASHL